MYGGISDPGMGPCRRGVALARFSSRDGPARAGFPPRSGRFGPGGSPFSSRGCPSCKGIEGFLTRGRKPILTGMRWLYVRPPASQRPASGAEVSTPCGAFRPGGSPFLSPGCRSCKCMEGFLIREWDPVVPGCRWLYIRSPANQRWARDWGFHTVRGGFDPGDHRFRPEVVRVVKVLKDF